MEITNWFKGFEKGIARLSPEERSTFFSECGKNCVNGGTLSVYKYTLGSLTLRLIKYISEEFAKYRLIPYLCCQKEESADRKGKLY